MITPEDRKKYEYYSDGAIYGIKLIEGLTNKALRDWIDNPDSEVEDLIASLMNIGGDANPTNPNWIQAQLAEEAYERDMISEKKLDALLE